MPLTSVVQQFPPSVEQPTESGVQRWIKLSGHKPYSATSDWPECRHLLDAFPAAGWQNHCRGGSIGEEVGIPTIHIRRGRLLRPVLMPIPGEQATTTRPNQIHHQSTRSSNVRAGVPCRVSGTSELPQWSS